MSNLDSSISEIENGINLLLEENKYLREEVRKRSNQSSFNNQKEKVAALEEEVKSLKKTIDHIKQAEMENQEKIFHIRKIIQDEIYKEQSQKPQKSSFTEKTIVKDNSSTKDEQPSPLSNETDAKPSKPSVEKPSPLEVEIPSNEIKKTSPNPFKNTSEYNQKEKQIIPPIPPIPEPSNITNNTTNNIPVSQPDKEALPSQNNSKQNPDENINTMIFDKNENEEDPFGSEFDKLDDDEFFKNSKEQ